MPAEARLTGGGSVDYKILGYDHGGRLLGDVEAELTLGDGWQGATLEGNKLTIAADAPEQAGEIVAKLGDFTSTARLRNFPGLPWKWDFEGYAGKKVPPTWVNAFLKLQPGEIDGSTVLQRSTGKGRPSTYFWIGQPEMKGYTIQADVMMREDKRKLPSIGLTAHRYNLILKGNTSKLQVMSWAPHLRMAREIRFRSDPDVWYTMKMTVQVQDDGAHIFGKVWERDKEEPEEWTIEVVDPHANTEGSPGLYTYSLADCYFDNVIVTE
jgi:hypothetical protein